MDIVFANSEMEEDLKDNRILQKKYGAIRAKLLQRRIQTIRFAGSFDQLKSFPGHFHELKGDREGQWACSLDQPYRLIFTRIGEGTVSLEEIVDYHGK